MMGRSASRIALVAPVLHPNDGRILKEIKGLHAAGYEVEAFAPATDAVGHAMMPGARMVDWLQSRTGMAKFDLWLNHRRRNAAVAKALVEFSPAVVLVSEPDMLPAALAVKQRTGARVIYDAHEFHEDERPGDVQRSAWVRRAHAKAAGRLDGLITVNQAIADLYEKAQPNFPEAVVVANAAERRPVPPYDGRLHEAGGLAPDKQILLFHGAMTPHRGLGQLAAAGTLLNDGWRVVMMGYGPLKAELSAAAPTVTFLPPVPHAELDLWVSGAALGALLYETGSLNQLYCTPNKFWELAACSVPILAADLPEVARLAGRDGFVNFIPQPPRASEIAAAVNALSLRDLERQRAAARTFATQHDWAEQLGRLIGLVERLIV